MLWHRLKEVSKPPRSKVPFLYPENESSPRPLELRRLPKEEEQIIVRVKVAPRCNVEGEQLGKIHKEEAVCRFCFNNIFQYENIFMTKCDCKIITLTHENCAMESQECKYCEEDIYNVPVTLSRPYKGKLGKPSPTSKRCVWNCFGFRK